MTVKMSDSHYRRNPLTCIQPAVLVSKSQPNQPYLPVQSAPNISFIYSSP